LIALKTCIKSLILLAFVVTLIGCVADEQADQVWDIGWKDLVPKSQTFSPERIQFEAIHTGLAVREQYIGSVVPELNGRRVKISAFVSALKGDAGALNELMLVPYFGACIHVPPPPSNQIIYFESAEKPVSVKELNLQRPVSATGILFTDEVHHDVAQAGYRMKIESVEQFDFKQ